MIYKIILFLAFISVSSVTANVDSAVVRIMTDFDNAKIQLNEVEISEDSYGNTANRFTKNTNTTKKIIGDKNIFPSLLIILPLFLIFFLLFNYNYS